MAAIGFGGRVRIVVGDPWDGVSCALIGQGCGRWIALSFAARALSGIRTLEAWGTMTNERTN
jgi:hypothetical protein